MLVSRRPDQTEPVREDKRYRFAVPMTIELSNGLMKPADRAEAFLVDLSAGGAALLTKPDARLKQKKRYRVAVDDHSGIIEVRNVLEMPDGDLRLGIRFSRLGLALQELVADSLARAKAESARLSN